MANSKRRRRPQSAQTEGDSIIANQGNDLVMALQGILVGHGVRSDPQWDLLHENAVDSLFAHAMRNTVI